jgi:hypothetical protein
VVITEAAAVTIVGSSKSGAGSAGAQSRRTPRATRWR